MAEKFYDEGDQNEIAFDLVADVLESIALVGVNITDTKEGLEDGISFVPVEHEHHQYQPLSVSHDVLSASEVL
jgi:hypothetical protein